MVVGIVDVMEVFCDVVFFVVEICDIVGKIGGCFVWGGVVNFLLVDDCIICVEMLFFIDFKG